MKLGEPLACPDLEGIFSCASVPMQLHVPSGFARRARSEMSTVQILPQGVLAASTMVGDHAGFGGDRTGTRCEPGLFLGPMEVSILGGRARA